MSQKKCRAARLSTEMSVRSPFSLESNIGEYGVKLEFSGVMNDFD